MTFSVLTVLRESARRLATGPAFLVLVALVVVETAAALVPGGLLRTPSGVVGAGGNTAPVLFTGDLLALVAALVVLVVALYLSLVTIRVFAGQWGIVERAHLTHRIGFGLLNLLGVFVVVGVVTVVVTGLLALFFGVIGTIVGFVVTLVVVAVSFLAPAFVAVEDDNAVVAFRNSLGVLMRAPLPVVGLLVALVVVNLVLQAIGGFVAGVLGSVSFLAPLVTTIFGALGSVFLLITVARAYDLDGEPSEG